MLNNKTSPRPQLPNRQTQPRRLQAVAQVHDYTSALPAGDAELDGFVRGLAALNPALDRYVNRNVEEQSEANRRSTLLAGTATGHSVDNPQAALAAPIQAPSFVPPAFDAEYRQAYGTAVAQRAAIDTKAAIQTRYEAEKGTDGFNLDAFLTQNRAQVLAGVQDPTMAGVLGSHIGEVEASIRASAHNEAVRKHEDDRLSTASKLTMRFTADMNPQQLAEHHFSSYVPQMRGLRVDPKQSASLLLNRVKALSDEGGGRPDLFAAFNERDSEGFSILDRNPQLADHITAARNQAQRQRDAAQNEAKQPLIAQRLIGYDDDIRDTPERVTVERLTGDVSSGDISAEKAASLWHQAQEELGRKGAKESLLLDADKGMLGYYDPKDQNKVLDEMLGAPAKSMWQAAVSGDRRQTTALAQVIMQRHSQTGATVPVDTLQRLVQTSVTNLPAAEGPSEKFMATAEVYRALAADPKYRSLYFKDDADQVMGSFIKHLDANGDAKTAYAAAYRSIDPAFKEQARKRAEAPEMQEKIRGLATKYASGSTMWGWLGGNGRPENQHLLGGWAATCHRPPYWSHRCPA